MKQSHRIASHRVSGQQRQRRHEELGLAANYSTVQYTTLQSTLQCESKSSVLYSSLSPAAAVTVQYGVAQLSKSRRRPRRAPPELLESRPSRAVRSKLEIENLKLAAHVSSLLIPTGLRLSILRSVVLMYLLQYETLCALKN